MQMPDGLDIARKLLSKNSLDQYELFYMRSSATKIDSKNQKIDTLTKAEDVGLSVRVKKNNKTGFSYTTSLQPEAIERAITAAIEVAGVMPEDLLTEVGGFQGPRENWKSRFDEAGIKTPIDQKIELAKKLEATCRQSDKRIVGVRSASISETQYEIQLLDHQGTHLGYEDTHYVASITCKAEENGDPQVGAESSFHHQLAKLDITGTALFAAQGATELLGAKSCKTMKCPAIIRNSVVSDLLDFMAGSFSGEEISKGRSMLLGKLNEKVFSDQISFTDDALLIDGYSARPFDAEGTPSQSTKLVENGVFKHMLLDRYYGKKLGLPSTAKASRSIKAPPSIGVTNLVLTSGSTSFEGLLKKAGHGIMITDLLGVHTANPVTGAFSLGASGIMIENGQLTYPVKGFAVSGNVLDLFRDVASVGSDFKMFGNVGTSSLLIPQLTISGD